MGALQGIYNWFKAIKVPKWYKEMTDEISLILIATIKKISKEVLNLLIEKIKELETKNMTGNEKFTQLKEYAKKIGIDLTKREANALLNNLVLMVKAKF